MPAIVAAGSARLRIDSVALWTALIGLLAVIPMIVLTPPLQVPDEAQHFDRAYQISELQFWSVAQRGRSGAVLPVSLAAMTHMFLGTTEIYAVQSPRAYPLSATLSYRTATLIPNRRAFTDFSGAAFYSPLPYLPQAAGIAVARAAGAGPLDLLYAARLINALSAIAVLTIAVALLPFGRPLLAFVGLQPMAVYEYASVSPDALTITTALLFTALGVRALTRGRVTIWTVVAMIATGTIFCSLKPVYAPLLLIALVPGVLRRQTAAITWRIHVLIVGAVIGATLCWLHSNAALMIDTAPGADPQAQTARLIAAPFHVPALLLRTLLVNGRLYAMGVVGILGWLNIALPTASYIMAGAGFAAALCVRDAGEPSMPRAASAWQISLTFTAAVLVMLALFVMWTQPGADVISGVQGRYFLPLFGLLGLSIRSLVPVPTESRQWLRVGVVLPLMTVLQIILTDLTIVRAFSVL